MNKLFLLLLLIAISCNKEIDTPTEESKQLFGKWELTNISGGFSGSGTPMTDEEMVEFSPNGVSKWYVNGKLKETVRFSLVKNGNKTDIIYNRKSKQNQRIFLEGENLYLSFIDCYDCYMYSYKKK